MEQQVVTGIAFSRDEAQISIREVQDKPGVAAAIFGPLAEANVNVDMIVQNVSLDGSSTDITFTVQRADLARAVERLERAKVDLKFAEIKADINVAKVSVIGVGMRSHTGVALKMFETLAAKGINIQVISTSEIKISVLVAAEYTELAVRALHTAYELDAA
jgi:aspartate kinase